jgi:probable HAF family extracellular repeat protein
MKLLALIVATSTGLVSSAGPIYNIIDLGTMGGSQSTGAAINQFGQVTGYGVDALGDLHAFTGGSSLGDITPGWANGGAAAYGINATGQVAGVSYIDGHGQATTWVNGTAHTIGGLGGPDSYATAINNNGQSVGMATNGQGQGRAVVYSNGQVRDIAAPESFWSSAYGINNSGTAAGSAKDAYGRSSAFTWSQTNGYTTLATLGGSSSNAFGINEQGEVVGNSTIATGYTHAALWGPSGVTDLGTLGGNHSYAYGINNSGAVVGYSYIPGNTTTHAFLSVGGVMMDMNLLIPDLGGWEVTRAFAINDNLQVIGTAVLNGVEHVVRLDDPPGPTQAAPEPGTIALVVVGSMVLVGGRVLRLVTPRA